MPTEPLPDTSPRPAIAAPTRKPSAIEIMNTGSTPRNDGVRNCRVMLSVMK